MIYFETTNINYHRDPNTRSFRQAIFVDSLDRKKVLIAWNYKPTNDDLNDYTVKIYRSYAQTEIGDVVSEQSASNTAFVDNLPNIYNTYKSIWYRLQIGDQKITEAYTWGQLPTPTALSYRRRVLVDLRFGGVPTLIYQKKLDGSACPTCFDEILGKSTKGNCPVCFGTGKVGGWFSPVFTLVHIIPPPKTTNLEEVYKQDQKAQALMGYYPVVLPRDILFDVNSGLRWRVESVTPARDSSTLISQQLMLEKMSSQDIENNLPIPDGIKLLIKPRKDRFDINLDRFKEINNE